MTAPVICIILIFGAQGALIEDASLALDQVVYQAARYAAENPSFDASTIASFAKSIAPPMISGNGGADLTVTVNPASPPRSFGTSVTVTIAYNVTSKIFVPNPFFGIGIPTTLTATRMAMTE